jgi:ABC-type glycerol-3-phosphate transport system substrate-binding protein
MINLFKRKFLLITMMSVVSLFLVACGQSEADSSGSSETQSTTVPTASPNSSTDMSKMQMPAKPSPGGGQRSVNQFES